MVYMSKKKRRRVMRKRILALSIAVVVIIGIFIAVWQAGLGSTLVTVGGKPIRSGTLEKVHLFLNYISVGSFPNYSTLGMSPEEVAEMEDYILLEQNYYLDSIMVPLEVLRQHFEAQGKTFPSEEAQATIDEGLDLYFSDTATVRLFDQQGVKREHVLVYLEYVAALEMLREEVNEANPITDEDVQAYYDENISYFTTPESFTASHILLMDADHTPERRAEIEAILERIQDGEDFAELAKEFSEDGSAENGGDLGTFYAGNMVAPFEEACLALRPGEVSGIVETDYGYHIIKMFERGDAVVASLEDSREEINSYIESPRVTEARELIVEAADIVYKTLVNPTTGKPPVSMDELNEARGIVPEDEDEAIDGGDIYINEAGELVIE